uniref:Uncharacterized protein LOC114345827 n=1 Tax=Diabrotica virgifera virgifera TaxID=50390 RepID=A0A6P7GRD9_DIAVI
MAHLNISFKEAEKVIDNPAYTSIVQKNRFAPLLSSTTEFPSLVSRPNTYSNIAQSSSKHLPSIANISNTAASTRKKRKIHPSSPTLITAPSEFSFCASPVFQFGNYNKNVSKNNDEHLKNEFATTLKDSINNFFSDIPARNPAINSSVPSIQDVENIINSVIKHFFT